MEQLLSKIPWNSKSAAVISEQGQWSFSQIDTKSDLWASHILEQLGKDIRHWPVAMPIIAERSADYIVALLACWKLGIGVAPIAVDTPISRLTHITNDLNSQWVINLTELNITNSQEIRFDAGLPNATALPETPLQKSGIAYIIYTSGTTGKPKGCVVGVESVLPIMQSYCDYFGLNESSRITLSANIAFDAAMADLIPGLISGARIYIVDHQILMQPNRLIEYYHHHQITYSWIATPIIEVIMSTPDITLPRSLKVLLTAGQRLTKRPPKEWHTRVENAYGPTETTVIATVGIVNPNGHGLPDIGTTFLGVHCLLVDQRLQPVQYGEEGELLIYGAGVSRGYLNLPELNNEKFIRILDAQGNEVRAYRSGDLCRVNKQGNIEYVSRIDKQLKLNGNRLESDEIIHHMLAQEGVKQAHAMIQKIGAQDILVGYIVAENASQLDTVTLQSLLGEEMPKYMIPQKFVFLDAFPLTSNQKLDESALSLPQIERTEADEDQDGLSSDERDFLFLFRKIMGIDIGWEDSFFQHGGASIAAISISAAVHKQFAMGLPFELFEQHGTPQRIWQSINRQAYQVTEISSHVDETLEYFDAPLSSSQRSIWFFANMDNKDRAYHAKSQLKLVGKVNAEAIAFALQKVVDRHSIFRTSFIPGAGDGIQRVHKTYQVKLQQFNLSSFPSVDREQRLEHLLQEELNQPFDLSFLPLVRWALVKMDNDESILIHIEHHLVHDGWSYNLFLKDFLFYYRSVLMQEVDELPFPAQYADFCITQAEWLNTRAAEGQLKYWKNQLQGAATVINLPSHKTDTNNQREGKTLRIQLPRKQWHALEKLAEQRGETPFSIMLGIYYLMLSRFSGDKDICVGSAFANRQWIQADSIIGMMINTVALRAKFEDQTSIDQLLSQSSRVVHEAQQNQDIPFEYLVKEINPERPVGINPFFQVFFGFHDSPMPEINLPGINHAEVVEAIDSSAAKFDLSVVVIPRKGQVGDDDPVHLLWEFKRAKYPEWLIQNMIEDYLSLLKKALENTNISLSQLNANTPEICGPEVDILSGTVFDAFRFQALAHPNRTAIEFQGQVYSYINLLVRVEQQATYLSHLELSAGEYVGICLPRSIDYVSWMLACQAAGVGYVPLDPDYPAARIEFVIKHSQITHLITHSDQYSANRIPCNAKSEQSRKAISISGSTAMYCIYTSGSTGLPKGVVISHGAFSNFIQAMSREFNLLPEQSWLAITSFSFDISTLELYLPLISGAKVVLTSQEDSRDIGCLRRYLQSGQISHCQATPSTWKTLISDGWRPTTDQTILCGGEAIDIQLAHLLTEKGNVCYNMYGPTETTVWSSFKQLSTGDDNSQNSSTSLGSPIANTQIYILDDALHQVPVGAIGQLWIGGASLSDGYLHNSELTNERFVLHPVNGKRIYQTGDLASIDGYGELQFHGRADQQVKLSGFRIELEEIEQIIKQLAEVNQVAVVIRNVAETPQLIAFFSGECDESTVLTQCRQKLPGYMIPHKVITLDTLPLTPNRKVDKKALPTDLQPSDVINTPQTPTEEQLETILSSHLGYPRIDTQRNFYKLGGNSLMAMKVCVSIEREMNVSLKAIDFIELGSITAVAAFIDATSGETSEMEFVEEMTI